MINLEVRLANDIKEEYKRNAPFEQFQLSYFMYKRCINQLFVLDEHTDPALERQMDTLYYSRMKQEWRNNYGKEINKDSEDK